MLFLLLNYRLSDVLKIGVAAFLAYFSEHLSHCFHSLLVAFYDSLSFLVAVHQLSQSMLDQRQTISSLIFVLHLSTLPEKSFNIDSLL